MIDQDPPQDPVMARYQHRDAAAMLAKGCGVPWLVPRLTSRPLCAPQPGSLLNQALLEAAFAACFPCKAAYQSRFLRFH